MPVTIPSAWPGVDIAPLTAGQPIVDDDLIRIIQADAYSYAYKGSVLHGVVYDPPWSTSSTSFVTATSSTATYRESLNQRWPSGHVLRRAWELTSPGVDPYTGVDTYYVTISVAGSNNLEVRAELWIDGVGSVDTVDIAVGVSNYATGVLTLPAATGVYPYLKFSARSVTGDAVTLDGLTAYETILDVDKLPLGT